MSVTSETQPLVSVIIPVYNGEEFIQRCVDSVLTQSMQDFELIAVNDGSTDGTLSILNEYAAAHENVRVLHQANAGQGAARNRALGEARGEFILFVDADDFIERVTLQVTTQRAVEDGSDLVHFDWKLYTPDVGRPGDFHYYNVDPFWHKRVLLGPECDELLRVQNFYSVTKLYRRSFLDDHGIRFEEGRIYEDNPFVLQAVNRAETASLVHSPLYTIDPRPDSSTRSHTDSDKHVRDHLYAVRRTFELLDRRNPRAAAYLAAYHVKKIGPYYQNRIPRRYRAVYIREFVDILGSANVQIPPSSSVNAPTRLASKLRMFERQRYALFRAMIVAKNTIMPRYKRARKLAKSLRGLPSKLVYGTPLKGAAVAGPLNRGTITFIGLDYKYTGNSRFLFEDIIRDPSFEAYDIKFVTKDRRVPEGARLEPGMMKTDTYLAATEFLIAESWIPAHLRKHPGATWTQLWHGTPIKRLLFDSNEPRIIDKRPRHKIDKYNDVLNWDFLVADSPEAVRKFETAFLIEPSKIIRASYPRVDYLLSHASTRDSKRLRIRRDLGVLQDDETNIVLYAPTWRDRNYGRPLDELRFDHLLDLPELSEALGDGYLIAFHDHSYLSAGAPLQSERCIDASTWEIQDLILAADVVLTDFSSLLFDALATPRRVVVYAADCEEFESSRGIYTDLWNKVSPHPSNTARSVAQRILSAGPHDPCPSIDRFEASLSREIERIFASATRDNQAKRVSRRAGAGQQIRKEISSDYE